MFTPFDASLLLFRDGDRFRDAFSLVPEYLKTDVEQTVHNYNEYGIQLGRRFRALKLWIQIRYFGVRGIAARLTEHCRMARELASWIEQDPDWELLAPVPFATVCFRHRPARSGRQEDERSVDERNQQILDLVNRAGRFYLSHTRLRGRFTLRVAIGNPRQTMDHVRGCWESLRRAATGITRTGS
jgi:aromatic-L-amino-acid decarboxylase